MGTNEDSYRHQIDLALKNAIAGDAILFVGAGMGYHCKGKKGGLPNGKKLAEQLVADIVQKTEIKEISLNENPPLSRIAQFYQKKIGPNSLEKILKESLECVEVSEKYKTILQLPWLRTYTTNFDNAIEFSTPKAKSFSHTDSVNNVTKGSIIHLNGSIKDTLKGDEPEIILTDWSYTARDLNGSRWAATFLRDLATARSVIFLGFSLVSDLDIARILASDRSIKSKSLFFVGPDTSDLDKATLEDFGQVYSEGFDLLSARLKQVRKSYDPSKNEKNFSAFEEIKLNTERVTPPSLEERQNFILYGEAANEILLNSDDRISEELTFPRRSAKMIAEDLIQKTRKDALIIGGMASGKSIVLLQSARYLLKAGHRVFFAKSRRRILEEIELISALEENVTVIFDDYVNFFDAVEKLAEIRSDNVSIVLSNHSKLQEAVAKRFDQIDLIWSQHNLDILHRDEIVLLNTYLSRSALWKQHSGLSETRRNSIIYNEMKSSLSLVMLDIVNSRTARLAFEAKTNPILKDDDAAELFCALLVGISLEFKLDMYDWNSLFSVNRVTEIVRKHEQSFSHFFVEKSGNILEPSRLAGAFILRRLIPYGYIIDAMMLLYDHFLKSYDDGFGADHYRVELMKYSRIEPLFRIEDFDKQNQESVRLDKKMYEVFSEYYDELARRDRNENNPEYWLQYGISLAVNADLTDPSKLAKVETIFETGRRKAGKNAKRSRNLSNFYARFQLLKAAAIFEPLEAFSLFIEATNSLSKKMMLDEEDIYPYKIGRSFVSIAASHFDKWDKQQQSVFEARARNILKSGQDYQSRHGADRNIEFMVNELTSMLKRISEEN